MHMGQKLKIIGWLSLGALAGAMTTVSLQTTARGAFAPLPLEELQQLAAVFGMVKSDYVENVDEKKLITEAISGMVSSLDPHSQYFDKKSFKEMSEGISGRFVGVGIEITQEDGLIKVVSPIEGSPADRAGLKTNDFVTKIDEAFVKGLSMNDAVKRMRGEPNTKVVLTVFRKEENRSFTLTIVREEIKTQSVKAKLIEPGYGWIRVSQFQERTVDDFARKLEEIYKQDPQLKGLVLDLRNDPGGLLDPAVALSAAFLPANVTVVSTNGKLEESKFIYKAAPQFWRRGQRRLCVCQRNCRGRLARSQTCHRHGQPDLWQGLGSNRASTRPRHSFEAHHRTLLHTQWPIHSSQRHLARCHD